MNSHEMAICAILIAALATNLYRISNIVLVFLVAGVLVILPHALPDPQSMGESWFYLLIVVEIMFGAAALCTRTLSSKVIAGFCLWNVLGHSMGLLTYHYGYSLYSCYSAIIRAGELSQALSLVLFSKPIINLAVLYKSYRQGGDDEWHRVEHGSR
jgi:hypothetical protein